MSFYPWHWQTSQLSVSWAMQTDSIVWLFIHMSSFRIMVVFFFGLKLLRNLCVKSSSHIHWNMSLHWNCSLWPDEVWQQPGSCRGHKWSSVNACDSHEHSSWSDHQHDQSRPNPGHNQRLHCQQRLGHYTGLSHLDTIWGEKNQNIEMLKMAPKFLQMLKWKKEQRINLACCFSRSCQDMRL